MSEEQDQDREPTPEELAEYREKMNKFYEEQLPLLRLQKEYETLLADIEEAKTRRVTMVIRQAQMLTPPAQPPGDGQGGERDQKEGGEKKRSLKKD